MKVLSVFSLIVLFQLSVAIRDDDSEAKCNYEFFESGCPDPTSECEDEVCTCPPIVPVTLYSSEGYPICLELKQYGEECFVNGQCESEEINTMECVPLTGEDADLATRNVLQLLMTANISTTHSRTLLTPEKAGKCQCEQGYYVVTNESEALCIRSRRHSEPCQQDEECTQYDVNSSCRPLHRFNACSCNAGFVYSKPVKSCVAVAVDTVMIETDVVDDTHDGREQVVVINCTYYDKKRGVCTDLSSQTNDENTGEDNLDGTNEDGQMLGMIVGLICLVAFAATSMWFCCCRDRNNEGQLSDDDTRRISPHDLARFYRHFSRLPRTSTPRRFEANRPQEEKRPTPVTHTTFGKSAGKSFGLPTTVSPTTGQFYCKQMDQMGSSASLPPPYEEDSKKQSEPL